MPAVLLRGYITPHWRKLITGLFVPYTSLNITDITTIITKRIITETQTQDSLRVCDLNSCNLLAETSGIVPCDFLVRAWFTSYRNHLNRESNPQLFSVVTTVPLISSKQTSSVLAAFFCEVSKIQKTSSPGVELRTLFRRFHLCKPLPDSQE